MEIKDVADVKILLVDDDESYLTMTKMYLANNGIQMYSISNPIEALEYIKEMKIDVVLLDYFMPEMTGEEFVKSLRKFNNETLVILQTGFSEEKPPIEMLTNLDIQGYHDKTKGIEELMLLTLSAIKVVKLLRLTKKQEKQINLLNYKKEFIGDLIVGLLNEAKDQVFTISTANESIEKTTDEYQNENNIISKANEQLNTLFNAFNYETLEDISIKEFINLIKELLGYKLKRDFINLNILCQDCHVIISKNIDILTYLIIEIVSYLDSKNVKDIDIICIYENDKIKFKICNEYQYEHEFVEKLNLLVEEDTNIDIKIDNDKITITI